MGVRREGQVKEERDGGGKGRGRLRKRDVIGYRRREGGRRG